MKDPIISSAINTLRTWKVRREVKDHTVTRDAAIAEAAHRWPWMTMDVASEIVSVILGENNP